MKFYEEALRRKVQSHLVYNEPLPPDTPLVSTEERASELIQAFARHIEQARLMGCSALENDPLLYFKVMPITINRTTGMSPLA